MSVKETHPSRNVIAFTLTATQVQHGPNSNITTCSPNEERMRRPSIPPHMNLNLTPNQMTLTTPNAKLAVASQSIQILMAMMEKECVHVEHKC